MQVRFAHKRLKMCKQLKEIITIFLGLVCQLMLMAHLSAASLRRNSQPLRVAKLTILSQIRSANFVEEDVRKLSKLENEVDLWDFQLFSSVC